MNSKKTHTETHYNKLSKDKVNPENCKRDANKYMGFSKRLSSYFSSEKPTGFPGGTVAKNPPANAGDTGSSPGLG